MKAAQIREQTDEELQNLLRERTRQVVDSKAKKGIGDGSEQPLRIRTLRRELARIKTIIRERERQAHE